MYARKQEYNSQIEGLMGMTYAHKLRHMVHPKEFIRGVYAYKEGHKHHAEKLPVQQLCP